MAAATRLSPFDHLVGGREQRWRQGEAEHPRGLGVDDKLELARLHDRQVGGLRTLEDTADIHADLTIGVGIFSKGLKAAPIALSSEWLFDSYTGHDQLLSYVQAMVVLEILLGEKAPSTGLGRLLGNRCAYLIGTTQEERAAILSDFDRIYEVRSDIVHEGKSRLTHAELELFSKLQWFCHRVIYKEIELLKSK